MVFIDSHCHLDLSEFDSDRRAVLTECKKAGLAAIIVPGVDLSLAALELEAVVNTGAPMPKVYSAVGLHPWWLQEHINAGLNIKAIATNILAAQKNNLANNAQIVAVGETGLDRPFAKKQGLSIELQIACAEQHIAAANELSLPIIFHCVKAQAELLSLLKRCPVARGGVIHGFAGSVEDAKQFIDKGMKIGVGGTITYERARKTREAVKVLSHQDLLLETDAPSMPLAGEQGLRNSPLNVIEVAKVLAQLRGESLEAVAAYTARNACELFGITL